MHDRDLEDQIRTGLRNEGDDLPLTITTAELERRLALRRRERTGRRFGLVAAGIGVVLIGSLVSMSNGWLGTPSLGSGPSTPPSGEPIRTNTGVACVPINSSIADQVSTVGLGLRAGDSILHQGWQTETRIGDRHALIDHFGPGPDPIQVEPGARLEVVARDPNACFTQVTATYVRGPVEQSFYVQSADSEANLGNEAALSLPPAPGEWELTIEASFLVMDPALGASSRTLFRIVVPEPAPTSSAVVINGDGRCTPLDVASAERTPEVVIDANPPNGASVVHSGQLGAFRLAGRDVGNVGSWDHDTIGFEPAITAAWPNGISVAAVAPDTCLLGVAVDAVPYVSIAATTSALAVDRQESEPRRLLGFSPPPVGDWFVRVHAAFQTTDGSEAFSETFFRIVIVKEELARSPGECDPADPTQSSAPPRVAAWSSPGDAMAFGGRTTAALWDGHETGSTGSWSLPAEPDWIRVDPDLQTLGFVTDACLVEVEVDALLTNSSDEAPDPEPIALPIIDGAGSRSIRVMPPPTGAWAVRVRATFATTDDSPAWSETLFAVTSPFHAPTLTMRRDGGVAISAAPGCPNYALASGALSGDTCGAPFEVSNAALRMSAASGQGVELVLNDGWEITAAQVTAVDADLVASGDFAPEHSVAFVERGGPQVTIPMTLDPGRWIVRVAVSGLRDGDAFSAHYDFSVEITP